MEGVQPFEIQVGAVHDIERAGLERDVVKNIHVMSFSVGNLDKSGDGTAQIQQRVQLYRRFLLTEVPHGKTARQRSMVVESSAYTVAFRSMPSGAVAYIGRAMAISTEQNRRKHASRASRSRRPESGGRCGRGTPDDRVCPAPTEGRVQCRGAFAEGQLRKTHAQKLIVTRKPACFVITPVTRDTFLKLVDGPVFHDLREDQLAVVHPPLSAPPLPLRAVRRREK